MTNGKKAAACGAAVLVAAVVAGFVLTGSPKAESGPEGNDGAMDFTIPDMNKTGQGDQVTKEGCVVPPRPDWTIDAPVKDWNKSSLLSEIYELRQREAIIESQDCSCAVKYPAWDAAQSEFDELVAGLSSEEVSALDYDISKQASKLLKPSLNVCRKYWSN